MPRYELRICLPDRPGSFGAAAVALGEVGANILTFEAVGADAGLAVDHVVVDVDPDGATRLPEILAELEGTRVEAFRPVPQRPTFEGPLELVDALVTADEAAILQTLADGVPSTLRVDWGVVLAERSPQPLRLAASVGAPTLVEASTPWLPLDRARALAPEEWVPRRWGLDPDRAALAAAPLDRDGRRAVLVVRRQGPVFRTRELRSLTAVALVAGRLVPA